MFGERASLMMDVSIDRRNSAGRHTLDETFGITDWA